MDWSAGMAFSVLGCTLGCWSRSWNSGALNRRRNSSAEIGYTGVAMIQRHDVRRELVRVVRGESALRDLSIWIAVHEDEPVSPAALDLMRIVQLLVGEYTGGHIGRERVVARLIDVVEQTPDSATVYTVTPHPAQEIRSTGRQTRFSEAVA